MPYGPIIDLLRRETFQFVGNYFDGPHSVIVSGFAMNAGERYFRVEDYPAVFVSEDGRTVRVAR